MSPPDVLHAVLDHSRQRPDHPGVAGLDRSLTCGELEQEVASVAAGLVARGVREGDRVALHLPNSVDFVVAALASLWVGAIFVPLSVLDPDTRLAGIAADARPALVVTADPGAGLAAYPWATVAELATTPRSAAPAPPADRA